MPDAESARLPLGGSSSRLYQYAVLQVVPDVARGERLNAGVVLLARTASYLGLRYVLETALWAQVAPDLDVAAVSAQLAGLLAVANGAADGGPIASLSVAQRFHWITSPASTVVQPSVVHTGLCASAAPDWESVLSGLGAALLR